MTLDDPLMTKLALASKEKPMSVPLRVLILEDRATDAELMLHELRRTEYEPDWRRVETELDYLTCLVPTLDVILADYTLPQFDALRALHFLQDRGLDIPFIVVTGSVGEEAAVECMKQGATDYLLKDRLGRLGAAVERALQQKHLRDEKRRADEEIKRLNRDLERRAKGLAALNKASQVMASTLELRVLLGRVMEQAKSLLGAEAASVLLHTAVLDEGGDELVFAAVTGSASEKLLGTRLPIMSGVAGWVIREKRPALVADAQSDPRFDNHIDAVTGMTTRSLLAVPLVFQDMTQGALEAVNKVNGTFDQDDLEMLEALASSAAIAIENARLYATEQQRTAALARALEQQRELDRLQREFIQNVSHELRTPLALIRGHAELLETSELGDLQPIQQKSASVISRRTRMLSKLVDDIIAVLTIESQELKREPLSLAQLVRTSLADFQAAAEMADLTLSAEIAPDLPLVSGDPVALHRMLDNLMSNALKFTSAKGHVTLRLFSNKDTVTLQVSDTGVGIPNDQLERIFDRFYQVDGSTTRHYSGVGLGLSLVKGIVEAHGGQITVASQVGQGTTFTVLLPVDGT
jgi:signal transduction histidine kinase/DNA-binding response OmpR family regulator